MISTVFLESKTPYSKVDEADLILNGYIAFLDPPKATATEAIKALHGHGIAVKVVTGDNDLVARKICKEVGLSTEFVLLGSDVEAMDDNQLADVVMRTTLFARVSPSHKQRIIKALQSREHVVGFMGDGINDAPALRNRRIVCLTVAQIKCIPVSHFLLPFLING